MSCSVVGCTRAGRMTRGLCNTHYARWQRHGDPGGPELQHAVRYDGAPCSVEDCDNVAQSRGLCAAHYKRWRRWGDPLIKRPRLVRVLKESDTAPGVSAQGLTGCIEDDCNKQIVARGLCHRHYQAWYRRTPRELRAPAQNLKSLSIAERFGRKREQRGPDECWPWNGSRHREYGHGEFFVSRERGKVPAHTFALELETGECCPPGKEGCHHCDNPPCCNPAHVYYGTRQQNVDDMWERGRASCGEARPNAKLTADQVLDIRLRFAAGELGIKLAADYGISSGHVSTIVNGIIWAHIGGPIRTSGKCGRFNRRKGS